MSGCCGHHIKHFATGDRASWLLCLRTLQLETRSAVICCQGREGSSKQYHPSQSCGHLSFPVMEALMSGSCPSASDKSEGQAGSSPPDGIAIIVKADGSFSVCVLDSFLRCLLENGGAKWVYWKLFWCGWPMQLQKQTRPGVCSAPDRQWTHDKGVHTELLQHGSRQHRQVSASQAQELVSPNAVTQGQAPYPRGLLTASPAGQAPGPIWGSLPSRAASALGEQHPHLPSWASNWCLWGGSQHMPVQVSDPGHAQPTALHTGCSPLRRHTSLKLRWRLLE